MEKVVIFTAGSGRSGTTTAAELFRVNVKDCIAEHEPRIQPKGLDWLRCKLALGRASWLDQRGFGAALVWYDTDDPRLDWLLRFKACEIRRLRCAVYFEANHAFLKSTGDGLAREFPDLKLVHLTRHPLEVSRSLLNRYSNLEPARFLRGFKGWNVRPGFRKNVLPALSAESTPLQYYVWAWIELELRFVRFLDAHPEITFFELDVAQLNDAGVVAQMLETLGVEPSGPLTLPRALNTGTKPTRVTDQDLDEARQLLSTIPDETLSRLRNPYDLLTLRDGHRIDST